MRIMVISHMYPSTSRPYNGIFVKHQVEAIAKLGHSITVVCPIPWIPKWIPFLIKRWKEFQRLPTYERQNNIEVHFMKSLVIPKGFDRIRGKMYYYLKKKFLRNLIKSKKIELLHAHTAFPNGELAILLKFHLNLPVVISIHGADLIISANKSIKYYNKLLNVLLRSDQIVLNSKKLQSLLFNKYGVERFNYRTKIIYNGIQIYKKLPKSIFPNQNITFNLITIASLTKQKNIINVLKSVKPIVNKYQNFKYHIIGDGWYKDRLIKYCKKEKIDSSVYFWGAMEHKKAMAYLKNSDGFILLSKNEAFGIVYIEAMYFGIPVIASKGEGIEEIIDHDKNGLLVNPNNIDQTVQCIEMLVRDKEKRKRIGEEASKSVWPKFSWKNNALAYETIYNKLIRETKS